MGVLIMAKKNKVHKLTDEEYAKYLEGLERGNGVKKP